MTTGRGPATERQADRNGRKGMQEAEDCRYRRTLAGFHVCWAASRVGIVTEADCDECPVPAALEDVDCHYLQPRVQLAPQPTAEWVCGATGKLVNPEDPGDCSPCHRCERRSTWRSFSG